MDKSLSIERCESTNGKALASVVNKNISSKSDKIKTTVVVQECFNRLKELVHSELKLNVSPFCSSVKRLSNFGEVRD